MKIQEIEDLSLNQLQIEFMRLSPTYVLAQRIEDEQMPNPEIIIETLKVFDPNYSTLRRRKFVPDTSQGVDLAYLKMLRQEVKKVRELYKEYGDINMPYEDWLTSSSSAARLFRADIQRNTKLIGVYRFEAFRTRQRLPALLKHLLTMEEDSYIVPDSIYLQIPLYAPDKDIVAAVKNYLNEHRDPKIQKKIISPTKLLGQRINASALNKKLRLLIHKAFAPDEPLWSLALKADLSKRYTALNKTYVSKGRSLSADDKDILNIITSRALANAQYICENAARGSFPSMQKVITPKYEWSQLRQRAQEAWPELKI